ncbi:MAG: MFS transporter [Candidatus Bathyarchaeia archaeon]|nr:MFS transporter [Candidatus Bathyarchaeota archaeon]
MDEHIISIKELLKFEKSLWILSFAAFLPYFASGMIAAFIMVWLRELGASFFDVGVVNAVSNLTLALSFLVGGSLSDKYGGKTIFILGLFLTFISSIFYSLSAYFLIWIPASLGLIYGRIAIGFRESSSFQIVYEISEKSKRASSFGLLSTFKQFGYIIGPITGGIIAYIFGLKAPFILAPLIILIGIIITYKIGLKKNKLQNPNLRLQFKCIKKLLNLNSGVSTLIFISLLDQFFLEIGNPFYMIFLSEEFKAPSYMLGLCFTVMSLSTFIFSMIGGISSDLIKKRKPSIVFGALLMAFSVGLVAFAFNPWMFIISYFIAGVSTAISNTAIPSYFTDVLKEYASTIFGFRFALMYFAGTFAPLISGWIIQNFHSLRLPFIINFIGLIVEVALLLIIFKE